MQPKLTPEEIQLLRQLNVRDRHALGGMARPAAADGLQALGYVVVHSPDSQDLLFSITAAGPRCTGDDRSRDVGSPTLYWNAGRSTCDIPASCACMKC
jgi:hypothetical protein